VCDEVTSFNCVSTDECMNAIIHAKVCSLNMLKKGALCETVTPSELEQCYSIEQQRLQSEVVGNNVCISD